jgi:purine-nucleoside phosphorylase
MRRGPVMGMDFTCGCSGGRPLRWTRRVIIRWPSIVSVAGCPSSTRGRASGGISDGASIRGIEAAADVTARQSDTLLGASAPFSKSRGERPGRFGAGPRRRLFPLTGGWGRFGRGSYAGMTYSYYDSVAEAAAWVRGHARAVPTVAVVLGSGLGAFADRVADPRSFPYSDIPNWPASEVIGHAGRLVLGRVQEREVAVLAGRAHLYEGLDPRTVTFAVRVLGLLGMKTVILTNAAGGVNTSFTEGALMIIDDHLNLMGSNPLIGPNDDRFGPRFPDMSEVYSRHLRGVADAAAADAGVRITHGIYAALHGPSYETPAEIRYLRAIGSDAVGMSTVPEAIVARHMGLDVLGISCITNMAAGVLPQPLDHAEVMETARRVAADFMRLLEGIIGRI